MKDDNKPQTILAVSDRCRAHRSFPGSGETQQQNNQERPFQGNVVSEEWKKEI